jgi:hypothetical protein
VTIYVSMEKNFNDIRYRGRTRLLETPIAGQFWLNHRPAYAEHHLIESADIVIEGFPRSANTYALQAMRVASRDELEVRGHTHCYVTVLNAVKAHKPCIVLVREPAMAVASLVKTSKAPRAISAARNYCRFYERLETVLGDVVIADFETVTLDFGRVVDQVNQRFGTNFPIYERTEENELEVVGRLNEIARRVNKGQLNEADVARPSAIRAPSSEVQAGWDHRVWTELGRARELYSRIVARAQT